MATRWARLIRGLIAAGVATFIAGLFHVFAGGGPPGWLGVTVSAIFAVPVAIFLAGTTPSWARLAVTVAVSQFLFHVTLGLNAQPRLDSPVSAPTPHHGGDSVSAAAQFVDMSTLTGYGALLGHDAMMLPAHLLAAALTVVILGRGEAAFWALLALTGLSIAVALAIPGLLAPRPLRCTHTAIAPTHLPTSLATLSPMRRRGPPVSFA